MVNSQTRNSRDFAANSKGGKASRGRKPLAGDPAQRAKQKGRAGAKKEEDFQKEDRDVEADPD